VTVPPGQIAGDDAPLASAMVRMLLLASGLCVSMVLVRFAYVADLRFRFCGLLLNLLLAWIPPVLAVLVRRAAARRQHGLSTALAAAWLLFFPNAFYITTDLIHTNRFGLDRVYWWYDHLMTVAFAAAGVFLGGVSLYLVHSLVAHRFGRARGWLFVGVALALGSFGIYLGRFLRFNSWDALLRPRQLAGGIMRLAESPGVMEVMAFCGAFFAYSLTAYCFIVAVARLPQSSPGRRV
jgi:uncharacterized membrane protein